MYTNNMMTALKNVFSEARRPGVPEKRPRNDEPATDEERDAWVLFVSRHGNFQVSFPSKVREDLVVLPNRPSVTTIKLHRAGFFYCVECRDYSSVDVSGRLEAESYGNMFAVDQGDFKPVSEQPTSLSGITGRQFEITYPSGMLCWRKVVVVAARLYRVDIAYVPRQVSEVTVEANCDRFFSSFKIL